MTLTISDVEQGSEEWLEERRGMLTASVIGRLITPAKVKPASNPESRALTVQLAAERITGWVDPNFVSDDMLRGTYDEMIARDVYAENYAPVEQVGFMVRDEDDYRLGYSPDGLVGDDGLIEIKSRLPKKHLATILTDEVPRENIAQCQCALFVTGRAWLDYISFSGGLPLWVKRVEPDPRWFEAIETVARIFERSVTDIICTYSQRVQGLVMTERTMWGEVTI